MKTDTYSLEFSEKTCLMDEDFYGYISGQGNAKRLKLVEAHLARCPRCRRDLAGLLEILHPSAEQADMEGPELSKIELDRAIAAIKEVSRKEPLGRTGLPFRLRWLVAAAAAIFALLGIWGLKALYEINRSRAFFAEAKGILEQDYAGRSPGNLRLALPFNSTATSRSDAGPESLHKAETLFFQAIAFRENMVEAHLGLAYIYLNQSKPAQARDEFQKVLDVGKENIQALIGRGVAQYEESIRNSDPIQRNALLTGALEDFNAVLRLDPGASEARYDKIWTLFESGLHKDALQEIESYLSRDSGSIWAEELRGLKARMRTTQIGAVQEDVLRSACNRNEAGLRQLVRQASYQIPSAISFALRQSLELSGVSAAAGNPNSEDLLWAAGIMEAAYSASTGDGGLRAFLDFYVGLSPPQRARKRALDREFRKLDDLYRAGKFAAVLHRSRQLEPHYATLKDFWQIADLHHLRGNSFYLGKADFGSAEAEFRKMLEIADRIKASDLKAKAMGSLAMICGVQRKFDDSLSYAHQLNDFAKSHHLTTYQIYASIALGDQFRQAGQFEQSLQEYADALGMAYRLLDAMKIMEILEDLGTVMDRLGRPREAQDFYGLALKQQNDFMKNGLIQAIPEVTIRRLNLLSKQGELALRIGDIGSAEGYFLESLKSTPSGMRELESRNRTRLAGIYLDTNRLGQAQDMLQSVAATGAPDAYPEIGWQTKSLEGRLLERFGNHREALLSLQQSTEILELMRRRIKMEDLRQTFFNYRYDPFKTMVSLLYESHEDSMKMLRFVDRAKSMTLREHLDPLHSASESAGNSTPGQKNEAAYTIIEYFWTNDGLLIFLTSGGKTEAVSKSVSAEDLSNLIRDYLESIRNNKAKSFIQLARRLYDELIAPVEKHAFADTSETLVILPDGPLHRLPFAGLQDPQGRFLIEKAPLAFAASRGVFQHCLLSNKRGPAENLTVTLVDGSANLPSARRELAYLSRLYGRNTSILGPRDFSLFKKAAAQSAIIHFSGHARNIQGKPVLLLQSYPREIYLDCQTISTWKMACAYLVNLAGCSTGIGPLSEGEAPWGLVASFLNAGAPAIIASLLPVEDASTERLNCTFYEMLRQGASKAEALQKAQVGLLNSARANADIKPQSWIPYILMGNPR